jgi:hypothetical protein
MKKFVWSETQVEGGQPFTGTLPKPPANTGPFQGLHFVARMGSSSGQEPAPPPEYYADAAVVAYRTPRDEAPFAKLNPKVTSSGGNITLAALTDGDLVTASTLPPAPVGEKSWVQFEFPTPQTFRGITLVLGGGGGRGGREAAIMDRRWNRAMTGGSSERSRACRTDRSPSARFPSHRPRRGSSGSALPPRRLPLTRRAWVEEEAWAAAAALPLPRECRLPNSRSTPAHA